MWCKEGSGSPRPHGNDASPAAEACPICEQPCRPLRAHECVSEIQCGTFCLSRWPDRTMHPPGNPASQQHWTAFNCTTIFGSKRVKCHRPAIDVQSHGGYELLSRSFCQVRAHVDLQYWNRPLASGGRPLGMMCRGFQRPLSQRRPRGFQQQLGACQSSALPALILLPLHQPMGRPAARVPPLQGNAADPACVPVNTFLLLLKPVDCSLLFSNIPQ